MNEFTINTLRFADCRLVDEDYGNITDVKAVLLEDVFQKPGRPLFTFMILEMGVSIKVELIEISNAPHNELMPSFVSGQNACPQEDCGGPKYNPKKLNRIKIEKELGILAAKIKGY